MAIESRVYRPADVAWFLRTSDEFGFFSNFARSPLYVGDLIVPTAEHYYQMQKFEDPAVRSQVALTASPFDAKAVARRHMARYGYPDWEARSLAAMRATLHAKDQQHPRRMRELFLKSGERPIVEWSKTDAFWGAVLTGRDLIGCNVLGRLLMELRAVTL